MRGGGDFFTRLRVLEIFDAPFAPIMGRQNTLRVHAAVISRPRTPRDAGRDDPITLSLWRACFGILFSCRRRREQDP
jgi:hypothetical protein